MLLGKNNLRGITSSIRLLLMLNIYSNSDYWFTPALESEKHTENVTCVRFTG